MYLIAWGHRSWTNLKCTHFGSRASCNTPHKLSDERWVSWLGHGILAEHLAMSQVNWSWRISGVVRRIWRAPIVVLGLSALYLCLLVTVASEWPLKLDTDQNLWFIWGWLDNRILPVTSFADCFFSGNDFTFSKLNLIYCFIHSLAHSTCIYWTPPTRWTLLQVRRVQQWTQRAKIPA